MNDSFWDRGGGVIFDVRSGGRQAVVPSKSTLTYVLHTRIVQFGRIVELILRAAHEVILRSPIWWLTEMV